MTPRSLALSLGVFFCVACPTQEAPAPTPRPAPLSALNHTSDPELVPEPIPELVPEAEPLREAAPELEPETAPEPESPEASPAPVSEATCLERSWRVVARELEETLRNFEEIEHTEALTLGTEEERERRCVQRAAIPDLDGDGLEEMDLSVGCRWNKVWPHMLFLSRGCRYAGQVWSAESLEYLPHAGARLPDIVTHSADGCAGWDFTEERHRWNGTTYESIERVTCDLCDDRSAASRAAQPEACDRDELSVRW